MELLESPGDRRLLDVSKKNMWFVLIVEKCGNFGQSLGTAQTLLLLQILKGISSSLTYNLPTQETQLQYAEDSKLYSNSLWKDLFLSLFFVFVFYSTKLEMVYVTH